MKINRNDECWCNSGLKYKKCHINYVLECRLFIKEFFGDNEAVYLEVSI